MKKICRKTIAVTIAFSMTLGLGCCPWFVTQAYGEANNVYYVKPQDNEDVWANKPKERVFTDLQKAIDQGEENAPAQVWVAVGEYTPETAPNIQEARREDYHFSLKNDVTVIGGFRGDEVVSSPLYKSEMEEGEITLLTGKGVTNHVFYHDDALGLDDSAKLNNVTISGGYNETYVEGETDKALKGGGMYNYEASPQLTDCVFTLNTSGIGAGLYNEYSSPSLRDCVFKNNKAYDSGAAIYNLDSEPVFDNCGFLDNAAVNDGGAVYNDNSSPKFFACTFTENDTKNNDGGAVYNTGGEPSFTDCTFNKNVAKHYGGALSNTGDTSATIINSELSDNTALYGGGVYSSGGVMKLINGFVNQNHASDGGGVYSENNTKNIISNTEFKGNTGEKGGGMSSYLASTIIVNSKFDYNKAEEGGGIYNEGGSVDMLNTALVKNFADKYGGGLYSSSVINADSRVNITNATIVDNESDGIGGGVYSGDYEAIVNNSIISGNKGDFVKDELTPQQAYNNSIIGQTFYTSIDESENVNFAIKDSFSDIYAITGEGNPAVDKGDSDIFHEVFTAINAELEPNKTLKAYDLSGNERLSPNGLIDLGAFEYGAYKGGLNLPPPTISALTANMGYMSGDKANSSVFITARANMEETDNFPLTARSGVMPYKIKYDLGDGEGVYTGEIISQKSEKYSFWTSIDQGSNSKKIPFLVNVNTDKPQVSAVKWGGQEENVGVAKEPQELTIEFSHDIRPTATGAVRIYSKGVDQGNNDVLIKEFVDNIDILGSVVTVDLKDIDFEYGRKYKVNVEGFKDDFDNHMEPYEKHFVIESSPYSQDKAMREVVTEPEYLESSGGSVAVKISGLQQNDKQDLMMVMGFDEFPLTVSQDETYNITSMSFPKNTGDRDVQHVIKLYSNGEYTGKEASVIVKKPSEDLEQGDEEISEEDYDENKEETREGEGGSDIPEGFTALLKPSEIKDYSFIVNGAPYTAQINPSAAISYELKANSVNGLATVTIPTKVLEELSSINHDFVIKFMSPQGAVALPVDIRENIPELESIIEKNGVDYESMSLVLDIKDMSENQEVIGFINGKLGDKVDVSGVVQYSVRLLGENQKVIEDVAMFAEPITRDIAISTNPGNSAPPDSSSYMIIDGQKGKEVVSVPGEKGAKSDTISTNGYYNTIYFAANDANSDKEFDDTKGYWGEYYINQALSKTIITGKDDNNFKPTEPMTRGEFVTIVTKALALPEVDNSGVAYEDVGEDSLYYKPIAKAEKYGLLAGFGQKEFKPDAYITREEIAVILNTAILSNGVTIREEQESPKEQQETTKEDKPIFKDVAVDGNNYYDIKSMTDLGIMSGISGDTFEPESFATRGEGVVAVMKMLEVLENKTI